MQASNKLGAIDYSVLRGGCDKNDSDQPQMLNGFKVSTSEKASSTVSRLSKSKRKKPNVFELSTDSKKRNISDREITESVNNNDIPKHQFNYENKGSCSESILLKDQCEPLKEGGVIRNFRKHFDADKSNGLNVFELGRVYKKNSEKEGGSQYTQMRCRKNEEEVIINLLNSAPESKLKELGYKLELHSNSDATKKIKSTERCFFIGKTPHSVIKFGLLESEGGAKKQTLVAIKKMTLKCEQTHENSEINLFFRNFKRQVFCQMEASTVSQAPSVLGIAVTETSNGSIKVYLAMDLVEGSLLSCTFKKQLENPLFSPVKPKKGKVESGHKDVSLNRRLNIARELACQLQFLHRKSIYHGDLKASNIIINKSLDKSGCEKLKVAIIDFGESVNMKNIVPVYYSPNSICNYFAPEVYHKAIKLWLKAHSSEVAGGVSLDFPKKADIFSLGFIFFQLLADCPDRMIFYKYDSLFPCFDSFFDGFDSRWNKIISSVSIPNEELVDLVRAMTHRDPRLRPTLTEVIEKLDRTLTQSVSGQ